MPRFHVSALTFGKRPFLLSAPNLWNWVAAIYAIQAIGSLAVMHLMGLRFSEVVLPILCLVLGASVAILFRWCDPADNWGPWKWWAPVVFYALFIFFLSNRSYPGALPTFETKLFHPIEYMTLGIFLTLAWHGFSRHRGITFRILGVLSSGILFAVSDEVHQAFIPGRRARVTDVLIDSVSVALGCALFLVATHKKNREQDEHSPQTKV